MPYNSRYCCIFCNNKSQQIKKKNYTDIRKKSNIRRLHKILPFQQHILNGKHGKCGPKPKQYYCIKPWQTFVQFYLKRFYKIKYRHKHNRYPPEKTCIYKQYEGNCKHRPHPDIVFPIIF